MILAVTEYYHDREPDTYFLNTEKLDAKDHIEGKILKACKKKSKVLHVEIDASRWDCEDAELFNHQEPCVNTKARVRKPDSIDKVLNLHIMFER